MAPASAVSPWPTVARMVGDFALSVGSKFLANEASRYLRRDEYDELRRRLSILEAEVRAHPAGTVPSLEYREALQKLEISRARLEEMGRRLAHLEMEMRIDDAKRRRQQKLDEYEFERAERRRRYRAANGGCDLGTRRVCMHVGPTGGGPGGYTAGCICESDR